MRGDWKDEAMQYRDLDRAAQERAEKELGAVMDGLAESVADIPDDEVLAEAREAGEDPAAVAARVQAVIRRAAGKMASPTPGPWHVGSSVDVLSATAIRPNGMAIVVADCWADPSLSSDEACANARLIAAAPRMAAALRALHKWELARLCHNFAIAAEVTAILRELDGGAR